MSETTMYYLGTGTEFIKAQCKPYKTIGEHSRQQPRTRASWCGMKMETSSGH